MLLKTLKKLLVGKFGCWRLFAVENTFSRRDFAVGGHFAVCGHFAVRDILLLKTLWKLLVGKFGSWRLLTVEYTFWETFCC